MLWLAIGAVVLAVLVAVGRGKLAVPSTRSLIAAMALAVGAGAVFAGLRGQWLGAGVLTLAALYLGNSARPLPLDPSMNRADARSLLGVDDTATADEIRAAHRRLMLRAHPDQGGTQGLAAQLNAARDRLLRG